MQSPLLKLYEDYVDYWASVYKGWARFWIAGQVTKINAIDLLPKYTPHFFQ
jgi:hypothetical protein